ncbi:MAG: response regulator transcription factor [Verrucomicrobiota bacterium]
MSRPIRILLADDHEVVRTGLRAMLARFSQIQVVAEAATASDALTMAVRLEPDVVLLDARMADGNSFEACQKILHHGHSHVLYLTAFADDDTVLSAVSAGAAGYLLKEISGEELVRAIEHVAAGQSVLDPAVTRRIMGATQSGFKPAKEASLQLLSPQETEVAALITQGHTNKDIALRLGISVSTVKNYVGNIMAKLHFHRRSQIASFYIQHTSTKSVANADAPVLVME